MKSKFERKKIRQAGFTLVEVMVTMVIIGLLATVVVLNVLPAQDKATVQKVKTDISVLSQALELYKLDMNTYPENLEGLTTPPDGGNDDRYQKGGYIKFLPRDPWNKDYLYRFPGENGPYDIWSLGADGQEGGEGVNADITNWNR
ncbi:MAG: type II secretion system major pseudopilin GspG [Hyphomonadaceae bacterium]|nr:type II secretion system major pseudopilin GspG [Hyphomonadaceae bacterium]